MTALRRWIFTIAVHLTLKTRSEIGLSPVPSMLGRGRVEDFLAVCGAKHYVYIPFE